VRRFGYALAGFDDSDLERDPTLREEHGLQM